MGLFSKKEFDMINNNFIETEYTNKLFGKNKLKSVLINKDLYKVIDSKDYETESRLDGNSATLLKSGSRFIFLNDVDLSTITFGDKLRELYHRKAIEFVVDLLVKYENIILYLEEVCKEDNEKELRFVIFRFKDKNISYLESVDSVRTVIENSLGKSELPDFPYIEVYNGRVTRMLRLTK